MTKNKLKNLSHKEVIKEIMKVRQELFELQFQQSTQKNVKSHLLKKKRCLIAQLLTHQTQLYKNLTD